jgi:hypothetical protein
VRSPIELLRAPAGDLDPVGLVLALVEDAARSSTIHARVLPRYLHPDEVAVGEQVVERGDELVVEVVLERAVADAERAGEHEAPERARDVQRRRPPAS